MEDVLDDDAYFCDMVMHFASLSEIATIQGVEAALLGARIGF